MPDMMCGNVTPQLPLPVCASALYLHLSMQSMDETENLVRMAMQVPQVAPTMRFDHDDFIDDAITADAQHQFRPVGRFNAEDW